jgi:hypothetical protein
MKLILIPSTVQSREGIPTWVNFDGEIPANAVKAGKQGNQTLYIGQAHHRGSLTPGKVPINDRLCFIPWGTISNGKEDFKILVSHTDLTSNWIAASDGEIPQNAFPGGNSEEGETLYIGRVLHEGALVVGKVQRSHRVCYIAFGEKELNFNRYEVFVV